MYEDDLSDDLKCISSARQNLYAGCARSSNNEPRSANRSMDILEAERRIRLRSRSGSTAALIAKRVYRRHSPCSGAVFKSLFSLRLKLNLQPSPHLVHLVGDKVDLRCDSFR